MDRVLSENNAARARERVLSETNAARTRERVPSETNAARTTERLLRGTNASSKNLRHPRETNASRTKMRKRIEANASRARQHINKPDHFRKDIDRMRMPYISERARRRRRAPKCLEKARKRPLLPQNMEMSMLWNGTLTRVLKSRFRRQISRLIAARNVAKPSARHRICESLFMGGMQTTETVRDDGLPIRCKWTPPRGDDLADSAKLACASGTNQYLGSMSPMPCDLCMASWFSPTNRIPTRPKAPPQRPINSSDCARKSR